MALFRKRSGKVSGQLCSLHSCYVRTQIWCKFWPIVSRLIHEVSPISSKVLILYFNFAVGPKRVGSTRCKGYSKFFTPVNHVAIYEGWTVIRNNFLGYTISCDLFFYCVDSGLSSGVSNWISSKKSRKSVYYDKTKCVRVTARARWSFLINMYGLERCSF